MMSLLPKQLARRLDDPHVRRLWQLTLGCCLVGIVAGFGAAAFNLMLDASREGFLGFLANYRPPSPGYEKNPFDFGTWVTDPGIVRWALLLVPALGGLISGLIVFTLAPEAEGDGTNAAIEAYHYHDGAVRPRVPLIKAIASAITIGAGGSAGREGPIAQIGSGFGSGLASILKMPPADRRVLMAAGMAAGVGAIFRAPLAGALYSAEVMYRKTDFEHEVLGPAFISSIVAYSVYGALFGFHPLFITPDYVFDAPMTLVPYLMLAGIVAVGAMLYVRFFYGVRHIMFHRFRRMPNHVKPMIGGLATGIVGFFLPEALATGYGVVQVCFESGVDALPDLSAMPSAAGLANLLPEGASTVLVTGLLLALIALGKICTTAFTVGSGGSGGVFGPAVAIGGSLGAATGLLCVYLFPNMPISPGAFALVGMAGFFAGAANTPVSTIVMVSEMTGNYNLLVPSMLVCLIAFALCRRFSLYELQLDSRLEAPTKLGGMANAILRGLTVEQALAVKGGGPASVVTIKADTALSEIVERYASSTQGCFPIVDAKDRLTGVIEANHIRRVVTETGMGELIIAHDIEVPAATVTPGDSLLAAVNEMVKFDRADLVVVDPNDDRRVVGALSRGDVVLAYNRLFSAASTPSA